MPRDRFPGRTYVAILADPKFQKITQHWSEREDGVVGGCVVASVAVDAGCFEAVAEGVELGVLHGGASWLSMTLRRGSPAPRFTY